MSISRINTIAIYAYYS